jgi:transposase
VVRDALYRGDVHKPNFVACVLAVQGKPRGLTFSLDAQGQAAFSRHLRAEDEAAVEVGQNAYYCYEQICAKVKRVVLVDTHRFALISRSKKKTGRQAATLLARFLKRGWLPTVSVPDKRLQSLAIPSNVSGFGCRCSDDVRLCPTIRPGNETVGLLVLCLWQGRTARIR